ncbi:hypothetical protein D3C76_1191540 [compost metagenome]
MQTQIFDRALRITASVTYSTLHMKKYAKSRGRSSNEEQALSELTPPRPREWKIPTRNRSISTRRAVSPPPAQSWKSPLPGRFPPIHIRQRTEIQLFRPHGKQPTKQYESDATHQTGYYPQHQDQSLVGFHRAVWQLHHPVLPIDGYRCRFCFQGFEEIVSLLKITQAIREWIIGSTSLQTFNFRF